jgi:integrator complex subunit 1
MSKGNNSPYYFQAREPRREAYTWSESQDQILVTWSTGEESTMHILVVHAMIILLNYGPGQGMLFKKFNLINFHSLL